MPVYAYKCPDCGHTFDELHTSFSAAATAAEEGVKCPKCPCQRTERDGTPSASMKGGGFRKYGLYTYS